METQSDQQNAGSGKPRTYTGTIERRGLEGMGKQMHTLSRILVILSIVTVVLAIIALFLSEGILGLESWAWSLLSINFAVIGLATCHCYCSAPNFEDVEITEPGGPR